jgi:hypothetical protein
MPIEEANALLLLLRYSVIVIFGPIQRIRKLFTEPEERCEYLCFEGS